MNARLDGLLRCPDCLGVLETAASIACKPCEMTFACVDGTPILLPSGIAAEAVRNDPANRPTRWRHARAWLRKRLPNIVLNVGTKGAAGRFAALVAKRPGRPLILNVGEKHAGPLLVALDAIPHAVHLRVDRALARDTDVSADCTGLPFADACADAVVVDSWLEHISEPAKAVAEIRRVLTADGLLYVDLPFMMPVHGGSTDFHRFTALGVQALFRDFEVLERGVSCGPAMALTQMTQYFALSFVRRQWARVTVKLVCRFALFWLKYIDLFLARRPGAIDCAAGTYMIGRRSDRRASDEELEARYDGIVPTMHEAIDATRL